jgi:hypothetical protein
MKDNPVLAAELCARLVAPLAPEIVARAWLGPDSFISAHHADRYADGVVLCGDPPSAIVIVEVQLAKDDDKRDSWPYYVTSLWSRFHCPVYLLVITVDPIIAAWCAKPIKVGHPGFVLRPRVLGPDAIPCITDPDVARAQPELSVLSAIAHADSDEAFAIARVAFQAIVSLPHDRRYDCSDAILTALNDSARSALEAWMSQQHEYQSELFRNLVDQGREEGRELGLREALIAVLEARGLPLSDAERARIESESSIEKLRAWLRAAPIVNDVATLVN